MIKLTNISKSFNDYKALSNLSIEVSDGEIYGLLGANGAGKSTTLNLILGFLSPDNGSIELKDHTSSSNISPKSIGYIPENVNLYPYLWFRKSRLLRKLADLKYSNDELKFYLSECGLNENFHKNLTSSYSKGMRQKWNCNCVCKSKSLFIG